MEQGRRNQSTHVTVEPGGGGKELCRRRGNTIKEAERGTEAVSPTPSMIKVDSSFVLLCYQHHPSTLQGLRVHQVLQFALTEHTRREASRHQGNLTEMDAAHVLKSRQSSISEDRQGLCVPSTRVSQWNQLDVALVVFSNSLILWWHATTGGGEEHVGTGLNCDSSKGQGAQTMPEMISQGTDSLWSYYKTTAMQIRRLAESG